MATITSKAKKQITITNSIKVDEVEVVGQQAIIDSLNPNDMNLNDWISNKELYKEHRAEIRELKAQFEDEAYAEQEALIAGGTK